SSTGWKAAVLVLGLKTGTRSRRRSALVVTPQTGRKRTSRLLVLRALRRHALRPDVSPSCWLRRGGSVVSAPRHGRSSTSPRWAAASWTRRETTWPPRFWWIPPSAP